VRQSSGSGKGPVVASVFRKDGDFSSPSDGMLLLKRRVLYLAVELWRYFQKKV